MKPNSRDAIEYSKAISDRLRKYVPLLKEFMGITLFGYAKLHPKINQGMCTISDGVLNERYAQKIYSEGDWKIYCKDLLSDRRQQYITYWPDQTNEWCEALYKAYGYWNGVSFITLNKNFIEIFWFTSHVNNEKIKDGYVTNRSTLERFVTYFAQENQNCLDQLNDEKYLYNFKKGIDSSSLENGLIGFDKYKERTKTFLKCAFPRPLNNLSSQEWHCIELIAKGRTMKEIGHMLNISPRTVESYVENAKDKVGCSYKWQLIDWFWRENDWVR